LNKKVLTLLTLSDYLATLEKKKKASRQQAADISRGKIVGGQKDRTPKRLQLPASLTKRVFDKYAKMPVSKLAYAEISDGYGSLLSYLLY
jgi:hypothetical protein